MKTWFVRLGKVINALKREGVVAGTRKTVSYLWLFLVAVLGRKKGDILFVTNGVGDSARFRSFNQVEELNLHGFRATVTLIDDPRLFHYADEFKLFVFQKTVMLPRVKKFFEMLKEKNKVVIFETDDLIFDQKYFSQIDYLKNINPLERQYYQNGVGIEILNDSRVTHATTTTTFLANKLREKGKQVFVVSNKLSQDDLTIAEKILSNQHKSVDDKIKIGYFSGTTGHDKSFATINNALMKLLERYSNLELWTVGPLGVDSSFRVFGDRVKQLPHVGRQKHFENIAGVDINIVPLEMDNDFCEAKSELKFFEAGIVSVPTVATANQTFREAIQDGVDGFVARDENEWIAKLERLIEDEKFRCVMGGKARQTALKKYSTKLGSSPEYYQYLKSKTE